MQVSAKNLVRVSQCCRLCVNHCLPESRLFASVLFPRWQLLHASCSLLHLCLAQNRQSPAFESPAGSAAGPRAWAWATEAVERRCAFLSRRPIFVQAVFVIGVFLVFLLVAFSFLLVAPRFLLFAFCLLVAACCFLLFSSGFLPSVFVFCSLPSAHCFLFLLYAFCFPFLLLTFCCQPFASCFLLPAISRVLIAFRF